jgi:hypothetical protein
VHLAVELNERVMRFIIPIIVLGLAADALAGRLTAQTSDRCLYGPCGSYERLFGPTPGSRDVSKRGYRSWNDIYNERNQDRYRSGIKAQPFDVGSPLDTTKPLIDPKKATFSDDHREARSEHVRWCLKRYHSYAVRSNTYVTYDGRTRFCDSPFD